MRLLLEELRWTYILDLKYLQNGYLKANPAGTKILELVINFG